MNCYGDLITLQSKAYLSLTGTDAIRDVRQVRMLEAASRMIDSYCKRFFHTDESDRYYDGQGSRFDMEDILSVSTLKLDNDDDKTYENSLIENTDYYLLPYNDFPKRKAQIRSQGSYASFANGVAKGIEITGVFGYGDGESATPYVSSTVATDTGPLAKGATTVPVTDGSLFAGGMTIRMGTEQAFVSSVLSNDLICIRGVNGTTDAEQADATVVYIYKYPMAVAQACMMQVSRWWIGKDSGFAGVVGVPEFGTVAYREGLDPDIKMALSPYRKFKL